MTKLVSAGGRSRRRHNEQFKQELVQKSVLSGMSLASVARQYGIHPNLLSRWVKERTDSDPFVGSTAAELLPKFVPVHVDSAPQTTPVASSSPVPKLEVNIDRGDVRIQFKVDASQMCELGHMLREILR